MDIMGSSNMNLFTIIDLNSGQIFPLKSHTFLNFVIKF